MMNRKFGRWVVIRISLAGSKWRNIQMIAVQDKGIGRRESADRSGKSFREVVNDTMRRGLASSGSEL
jgi:hypothetical protein